MGWGALVGESNSVTLGSAKIPWNIKHAWILPPASLVLYDAILATVEYSVVGHTPSAGKWRAADPHSQLASHSSEFFTISNVALFE